MRHGLRTNAVRAFVSRMTEILVFAQQKGGAGKTTLLVQLAHAFTARGRRVRLVDLDPQGSLSRWAALRNDPALPCEAAPDWQATTALKRAGRGADLVLVDLPGAADVLLRAAIRAASHVLIPLQPSPLDAWATRPTLEVCAREKASHFIVLNRVPPRGGAIDAALAEVSAPVLPAQLGARVAFSNAFLEGRAAAEIAPRSKAAEEAAALADAVEALSEKIPTR